MTRNHSESNVTYQSQKLQGADDQVNIIRLLSPKAQVAGSGLDELVMKDELMSEPKNMPVTVKNPSEIDLERRDHQGERPMGEGLVGNTTSPKKQLVKPLVIPFDELVMVGNSPQVPGGGGSTPSFTDKKQDTPQQDNH